MALSSLIKTLGDKLSYFSNWKFNFQKTRVIGSLQYTDEALERMASTPFFVRINRGEFFYNRYDDGDISSHRWSFFYEEALFLNYVVDNWKFDLSRLSKYEQADYNLAVEKLKAWNDLRVFVQDIESFVDEIRRVTSLRRASGWPSGIKFYNFPIYESTIVSRYHAIMKQLESYPEWANKFKSEVEPQIKQLADVSPVSLTKLEHDIFHDINLHSYFK
ncbi:hypothetical protein SteCoe_9053 [Stentor coeruleus]|uniref:Uncharacterized protein n=1 Tax=Stentor coeruleus TaxID=5963 RepID=A0A1R2CIS7_9CILI|nr:hypothetical protein SteCoe_9053 [Stentor coeruleus]